MSKYTIEDGNLKIDLQELISNLGDGELDNIADFISWDRILERLDKHIQGDTTWWTQGAYMGGHNIREHIEKVQGTKDQRVKDLEYRIRTLEHEVKNYQQYYEWYWRWYHSPLVSEQNKDYYLKMVGEPRDPKPKTIAEVES